MPKQMMAPRAVAPGAHGEEFLRFSYELLREAKQSHDRCLFADAEWFLTSYLSAEEQRLPRSPRERLDAQMLLRRVLVARRCYGIVYGWYTAFKFPYGEDSKANLSLYVKQLRAARDGYSWVSGYGTVLEVGCGEESLGLVLARQNRRWIASDVRHANTLDELMQVFAPVGPMEFQIIDGVSLDGVSASSIDAVISRSFFEHLLLDDASRHVESAFRVLRPHGDFIVYCPAGIGPPSDVTREFPEYTQPVGLHIKEYRVRELVALLRQAGFRRIRSRFLRLRGLSRLPPTIARRNQVPPALALAIETCAGGTYNLARRWPRGGSLWNQIWGHLGATAVFLVATK